MSSYTWLENDFGLEPEEAAIYEWQYRLCGGFQTALWDAIRQADNGNLNQLSMAFPVEVNGYRLFSQTSGWWDKVEKKFEDAKPKKGGK